MKKSIFTTEIEISEDISMLYNTLSRKFYEFKKSEKKYISELLENVNKGIYSREEISIIKEWLEKKIIVKDDSVEIVELMCAENKARFDNSCANIMILVTNDCNFRCVYCVQEHIKCRLNESSIEKILTFIDRITIDKKRLHISWFGGEPTLEYKNIEVMSKKIKVICDENRCTYSANITTNGYLLDRAMVEKMLDININRIQITLDGNREIHDSRRVLVGGKPTFDIILKNFLESLDSDMLWVLRINVDEESVNVAHEILELIPQEHRHKVIIDFCNLFQENGKNSLYNLYKLAIEMGYEYDNKTRFIACEACRSHGYFVNADGKLLLCPNATEEDKVIGYINEEGYPYIEKGEWYHKLKIYSNVASKKCQECIQLPFCINNCQYGQCKNKQMNCNPNDGLSYIERARLDYTYEKIKKQKCMTIE